MLGLPGTSRNAPETVVYAPSDPVLRLEIGGRLPHALIDAAEKLPDIVRGIAGGVPDRAKAARQKAGQISLMVSDRAKSMSDALPDRARSFTDRLPDRDSAAALVERLPDPVRDLAQDKLGLKPRRRSRWKTIAIVAAVAGGVAAAVFVAKRFFAPGYDEESLYDGYPEDRSAAAGEPHAYPAAGSGTGWPETQRTPEHIETPGEANGAMVRPPATAAPTPIETRRDSSAFALTESPKPDTPATALSGGMQQQSGPTPSVAPMAPPHEPRPADGSFYAPEARGGDAAPAQPSLPAQRPEAPLSEEQAEMNARLQLKQDQLYAAFPGMEREDIVASDGYLDRLTEILVRRSQMSAEEVRAQLDEILETGPKQATNPVLPDAN